MIGGVVGFAFLPFSRDIRSLRSAAPSYDDGRLDDDGIGVFRIGGRRFSASSSGTPRTSLLLVLAPSTGAPFLAPFLRKALNLQFEARLALAKFSKREGPGKSGLTGLSVGSQTSVGATVLANSES
jgi:hypothetical protein